MRGLLTAAASSTAFLSTLAFPGLSEAEERTRETPAEFTEARNGVSSFSRGYFDSFSPVTALDMVLRVPGFAISDGDTERRGLGDSFGNVLINGARPSNKSLSLETVLQRIPVSEVDRIELIAEALPDYNMRGHARLVNVVLVAGTGSTGSWDARVELMASSRVGTYGLASYSTSIGPVELSFGIDTELYGNRVRRRFSRLDANNALTEIQRDSDQRTQKAITPSISLDWQINADSDLRLDLQGGAWVWGRRQVSYIDAPAANGLEAVRFEQNATENHGSHYLGSASYTAALSDQISMQTIGLVKREIWDDGPEVYETYDPTSGFLGAVIVDGDGHNDETALRQTLAWTPNERNTLEIGGEIAVNSRDTYLALFEDDGTSVTPVELPVASTRVEETRSEIFINHTWTINDQLSLESGLRYEFSEIVQTGDAEQSRSFAYPKPSITLNWRHDDSNRLRLTALRDVAQLDFGKFSSSVDVADNNASIGNPDYVPQRTWTLEAEWERRFGETGSFSLRAGYDWIEDLDDWIPVITPEGVYDAPGNIGDGTNFRITTNLTTPLDGIGLPNAVLDVFTEWYNTSVEDPLTGEDRPFSGSREWRLGLDYRQSFPAQQIAWGWAYSLVSDSEEFRARQYYLFADPDSDLDVYVETTRWGGVTIRFGVNDLITNGYDRERIFYSGPRALGIIAGTEYRNASMLETWYLRVRGTF